MTSPEPTPRDNSELPEHRVALVLFATVRAVDDRDAASLVELAIANVLRDSCADRPGPSATLLVRFGTAEVPVRVHQLMELGSAGGNGYVWIKPTNRAFRYTDEIAEREVSP